MRPSRAAGRVKGISYGSMSNTQPPDELDRRVAKRHEHEREAALFTLIFLGSLAVLALVMMFRFLPRR